MNNTIGEMSTFIGMQFMMGLVKLPAFSGYWPNAMRYPSIADNMPCSRFKVLLQNFQFVDNSIFSEGGEKLFKISPVTEAARKKCLKVEVNTVNEQIIPSKTKYTKIRQYNAKKPCKWEFKNIVRAEKSDFMSDLDLYCGKEDRPSANYDHLSASA